ncbi:MAG: nucleotidyltransferase family protein [Oscillospiraceae bacterium]|nr:nucleotidyltransferase family protein [Oscillospiraceae bacterium]
MVAGIIAEYNPFHRGHAWHIAQTRAVGATHVVVVMSGCTVQRGEFAIAQTHVRARMALENGADLVILLPTPWSCARAQDFARAGVHLLDSLGCVDILSFGSESADLALLQRAAALIGDERVVLSLRKRVGEGEAFARARQGAVAELDPQAAAVLRTPNDTLGVEYINAIKHLGAKIEPFAIKRVGAAHDEIGGEGFANASELRKILLKGEMGDNKLCEAVGINWLQEEISNGRAPVDMQCLETAWLLRLRAMQLADFAALPDISEGMEHLLYRAVREKNSVQEILQAATGKRYPAARVRRALFHALLGETIEGLTSLPRFTRIIGHTKKGRELLHLTKVNMALPIISRMADVAKMLPEAQLQFAHECRAADIMALAMPQVQPCGMEQRRRVFAL